MSGEVPRMSGTVSGLGDKSRHPLGQAAGGRAPEAQAPWRKRVGIEPTIPGVNPESTDLKSAEAARPHALPRCGPGRSGPKREILVELTGIEPPP